MDWQLRLAWFCNFKNSTVLHRIFKKLREKNGAPKRGKWRAQERKMARLAVRVRVRPSLDRGMVRGVQGGVEITDEKPIEIVKQQ